MTMSEFLELLKIIIWPAVAISAIVVVRPSLKYLMSGAKVKFSVAGQTIETTLPELKQIVEEQAIGPLSPQQVEYLNSLYRDGMRQYPAGPTHDERVVLRPLRNAGLILTIPRNAFLQNARGIELSGLGRLFLRTK